MNFLIKALSLSVIAAILAACGGGSSSSSESAGKGANLAAYIGTWQNDCISHRQTTVILSSNSNGTLSYSGSTRLFDAIDCTGPTLATSTSTSDATVTYVSTITTDVVLPPSVSASSIRIDNINIYKPQNSISFTGSTVTDVTNGGVRQWCLSFSNGDRTCSNNDGITPSATATGFIHTNGAKIFFLSQKGSSYVVDGLFTKK